LSATQLDSETVDIIGAGDLTINATTTPSDHDFANLTKTTTGNINLNVANSVDVSTQNLGGVNQYTVAAGQTLTLLNSQLTSAMIVAGAGSIVLNTTSTANTDLSSINNDNFSGTITLNGSADNNEIVMSDKNDIVNLSSGNDTVTLGAGTNTVNISATNLTSTDNISGTGTDTVNITTAGTVNLTGLSNIETVNLANGTNTVTVGTNNGTINGGSGADTFRFTIANLSSSDIVVGNGGTDTIEFIDAGTLTASQLSNIDVENITLANGTNSITVGTKNFNIIGGNGDDTFNYAIAEFNASDVVNGNGGTDNFTLSSSGTIASTAFANVTNVENLNFHSGNDTLQFTDLTSFSTLSGKFDSIDGGAGTNDTITFSSAADGTLDFSKYSNFETLTLSGSADNLIFTDATAFADFTGKFTAINGGASNDTLTFTNTVTTDLDMSKLSNFEIITFSGNGDAITFGSDEFGAGIRTVNLGGGTDSLTLANTLATDLNAATFNGEAGSDTLIINKADLTNFSISGFETINANENINLTGKVDSTVANITVASGKTLTVSATDFDNETIAITANGNVIINATTTTNDHDFGSISKTGSGDMTLVVGGNVNLVGKNLGAINKIEVASGYTVTLSQTQLGSVTVSGAGNTTVQLDTGTSTFDFTDKLENSGTKTAEFTNTTDFIGGDFANITYIKVNSGVLSVNDTQLLNQTLQGSGNITVASSDTTNLSGLNVSGYSGTVTVNYSGGNGDITGTSKADIININGQAGAINGGDGTDIINIETTATIGNITNVETINANETNNLTGKIDNVVSTINIADTKALTLNASDIGIKSITVNTNTTGTITINALTSSDLANLTLNGNGVVNLNLASGATFDASTLLTGYTGTVNIDGVDAGNETLTLTSDMVKDADIDVDLGTGTDTLNINDSATDFSATHFDNLDGIENLNFADSADTVTFTDKDSFDTFIGNFDNIDFDGGADEISFSSAVTEDLDFSGISNLDKVNFADNSEITFGTDEASAGISEVNLGDGTNKATLNDIADSSNVQVNGRSGSDEFVLDFSRINQNDYQLDGGGGSDTVKATGAWTLSSDMDFANIDAFDNIESIDLREMTLSGDDSYEFMFTGSLINSWSSSNNISLKLTSEQLENIGYTDSTGVYQDSVTADTTYSLQDGAQLIIEAV
jgi:hypothetical protein